MSRLTAALVVLATALTAAPALAAPSGSYKIDNSHSVVMFRIKHLGVTYFYGRFRSLTGGVDWNAEDPTKSKINIEVAADSVYTANAKRDKHIMSPDFLDAAQFPKLTFVSSSIAPAKQDGKVVADTYTVKGQLTAHGVTKEVSFDFKVTGSGDDPWGNVRIGAHAVLGIKRSEYGMTKMLDKLGDEIQLTISLSVMKKK